MAQNEIGSMWPEQNAVEEWWNKHSLELKTLVTKYRLEVQSKLSDCMSEKFPQFTADQGEEAPRVTTQRETTQLEAASERIAQLEAKLAECQREKKELAEKYVGDLGQELQRLSRELDKCKSQLIERSQS